MNTEKIDHENTSCLILFENMDGPYTGFYTRELIELKKRLMEKPWRTREIY
jgi:hypothetical protein